MRWSVAVLFVLVPLAGCSDNGGGGPAAITEDFTIDVQATSTTGVIRGVVFDAAIRPLMNATVSIASLERTTKTNELGNFGFDDLEPGTYFLSTTKFGYTSIQSAVEVVAGENDPQLVRVQIEALESAQPFVEEYTYDGFLACGVAVILTSIGCSILAQLEDATNSKAIFEIKFERLPMWTQGELVWEQTQPAGGELIWEVVVTNTNTPVGYRETTSSPALAYWNDKTLEDHEGEVLDPGISYRFFGGPHPLCKPAYFGCGLTLNQKTQLVLHNFYNFIPDEGWRFTVNGPHPLPE